jgi:hypothetical protein
MRQAALILALVAALAVAGRWAESVALAQGRQGIPASPKEIAAVAEAKRAKLAAAKSTYELMAAMAEHAETRVPDTDERYAWSRRWMEAERECAADDAGRRAAADTHLARMKRLLDVAQKRLEAGMISATEAAATRYYVAEAEQWVAEAGGPQ